MTNSKRKRQVHSHLIARSVLHFRVTESDHKRILALIPKNRTPSEFLRELVLERVAEMEAQKALSRFGKEAEKILQRQVTHE